MKIRTKQLIGLLLVLLVTGCAEKVSLREGQAIHLVPMTYSWSASFDKRSSEESLKEIEELIENNWSLVAAKGLQMNWSTKQGRQFVISLRSELISKGVDARLLMMEHVALDDDKALQIDFHYTQVVTELCTPNKIGTLGQFEDSCYAENARWQSMVNPEKMIASPVATK